jgi:uncharacterized damage-inducible protein DinB
MTTRILPLAAALATAVFFAEPAPAQPAGIVADLTADVAEVESKVMQLAKAMPDKAWDYRAGKARSAKEVFVHLIGDNYFLPAMGGAAAPAATGITGTSYDTVIAFEKRAWTRAQAIAELEASFAFLKKAMAASPEADLGKMATHSKKMTNRQLWIATATHLHEHLGQLIAYARANDVVPPWSK